MCWKFKEDFKEKRPREPKTSKEPHLMELFVAAHKPAGSYFQHASAVESLVKQQ